MQCWADLASEDSPGDLGPPPAARQVAMGRPRPPRVWGDLGSPGCLGVHQARPRPRGGYGEVPGCVGVFGRPGRKFGGGSLASEETGKLRGAGVPAQLAWPVPRGTLRGPRAASWGVRGRGGRGAERRRLLPEPGWGSEGRWLMPRGSGGNLGRAQLAPHPDDSGGRRSREVLGNQREYMGSRWGPDFTAD